jgi:hypothetical protein
MNSTLTSHPSTTEGLSQCDLILAAFQAAPERWIPMPELARVGAGSEFGFCMVHSRVADLRKRGHSIDQRSERLEGKTHSFYRLN